jgi:hypothetical protein
MAVFKSLVEGCARLKGRFSRRHKQCELQAQLDHEPHPAKFAH